MASQFHAAVRAAIPVFLVAALFAGAADAKGGRRSGGSSSSSSSASKSHAEADKPDGSGFRPSVNLRSSSSSSTSSAAPAGARFLPLPGERGNGSDSEPVADAEEEARRAANLAIYQRLQGEKAAAAKVAAEKAEEQRIAADKEATARNAQVAAQQRAAAAKVAAAQEHKRRDAAAVAADVERVLQRAKSDYPVLATSEGESILRKIIDRQQAIAARGIYPSIAMVEAISDHAYALAPRQRPELQMVSTNSVQPAQPAQPPSFNGCRWVTSIKWSCD